MPSGERAEGFASVRAALGVLGDGPGLVFRGGTALRLCSFADSRYSADLDFAVVADDLEGASAPLEAALALVTGAGEGGESVW